MTMRAAFSLGRCLHCRMALPMTRLLTTSSPCSSSSLRFGFFFNNLNRHLRINSLINYCSSKRLITSLFSLHQLRLNFTRNGFRRNYATENKRKPKRYKDLRLSDLKDIAVLALPHKWRILSKHNCLIKKDYKFFYFKPALVFCAFHPPYFYHCLAFWENLSMKWMNPNRREPRMTLSPKWPISSEII
jgi:hypothetical protein